MNSGAARDLPGAPDTSPESPDTVRDALWGGRLPFWQPARGFGYRFNLDPILLANFLPKTGHLIDLGAGVGIIGLMALALNKATRLTSIERQPQLAGLLRRNIREQKVERHVALWEADLRQMPSVLEGDLVVFNPPYFEVGCGRPCQEAGRDQGRREVFGTLADFVRVGARATRARSGGVAAIIPWARRAEIEEYFQENALHLQRSRPVCPRAGAAPSHLMTLAGHIEGHVTHMEAVIVHEMGTRSYSEEVSRWLCGP